MRSPGDPIAEPNVHLRIVAWKVDYEVYFDRIPAVGERITGPDDLGMAFVSEIDWRFDDGFAFPPAPMVIAKPL